VQASFCLLTTYSSARSGKTLENFACPTRK
jgi:hypothetical protein